MGKPSTPAPPDYRAAATEQGEVNREALAQQTWANRPTQVTPWGRMDWRTSRGRDPATGAPITEWTQESTLDPRLQGTLDTQIGIGDTRSTLAGDIAARLRGDLGQPMDYSGFREVTDIEDIPELRDRAEQGVYGRMASRLDPRFSQRRSDMETMLRNRGLRPGDEAYDREMANLGREETDAYQAAMMESIGAGRAEAGQLFSQQLSQQAQAAALRDRDIREALQQRGMSLEEVNMLLAGQGVQPAAMPGVTYSGMATPPNYMQAANQQYSAAADRFNAQQAQRHSFMTGLGRLAMAGASGGFF